MPVLGCESLQGWDGHPQHGISISLIQDYSSQENLVQTDTQVNHSSLWQLSTCHSGLQYVSSIIGKTFLYIKIHFYYFFYLTSSSLTYLPSSIWQCMENWVDKWKPKDGKWTQCRQRTKWKRRKLTLLVGIGWNKWRTLRNTLSYGGLAVTAND